MIHVDTNFLIRALVPGTAQDGSLRRWLDAGETLAMSAVGWAEFLCGPLTERQTELAARILDERISVTEEDAAVAAKLYNSSGRRRGSLADCLIAATALRFSAPLATTNVTDFERFEPMGLRISR